MELVTRSPSEMKFYLEFNNSADDFSSEDLDCASEAAGVLAHFCQNPETSPIDRFNLQTLPLGLVRAAEKFRDVLDSLLIVAN